MPSTTAVVATLDLRLKRLTKNSPVSTKFNVKALTDSSVSDRFALELHNRFTALDDNALSNWQTFWDSVQEAASKAIGMKPTSNGDWISNVTFTVCLNQFHQNNDKHKNITAHTDTHVCDSKTYTMTQCFYIISH